MKIAICTPVHSQTAFYFTQSLAELLIHSTKAGHELRYISLRLSHIEMSRVWLAAEAISWGASHILWIDADQTFPANTLERLLAHGHEIVGCNYPMRCDPTAPTAVRLGATDQRDLVWTGGEEVHAKKVEEVESLGFGLILTAASVFDKIGTPSFDVDRNEKGGPVGEDRYFCLRARKAGLKIMLDHALSWEVGHVHETVLFNSHTLTDRARWMAQSKPT